MFAGCWQIMPAHWQLIRVEGIGYWQLIQAGNRDVCRSCDLCLQAATISGKCSSSLDECDKKTVFPSRLRALSRIALFSSEEPLNRRMSSKVKKLIMLWLRVSTSPNCLANRSLSHREERTMR